MYEYEIGELVQITHADINNRPFQEYLNIKRNIGVRGVVAQIIEHIEEGGEQFGRWNRYLVALDFGEGIITRRHELKMVGPGQLTFVDEQKEKVSPENFFSVKI